jgi:hypothetical protein
VVLAGEDTSNRHLSNSGDWGIIGCGEVRYYDLVGEGMLLSPSGLTGRDKTNRFAVMDPEQNFAEQVFSRRCTAIGPSLTTAEAPQVSVVATERLLLPRKLMLSTSALATKMR